MRELELLLVMKGAGALLVCSYSSVAPTGLISSEHLAAAPGSLLSPSSEEVDTACIMLLL